MPRRIAIHSFLAMARREANPASAPLVSAGRFDARAIMAEAVKLARSINRSFGSWQVRMSIALRSVWKRAKAAMTEACKAEPFAIRVDNPQPLRISRPAFTRRSTAFVSGSRSHSHGW